jgi:hypothetical protein
MVASQYKRASSKRLPNAHERVHGGQSNVCFTEVG